MGWLMIPLYVSTCKKTRIRQSNGPHESLPSISRYLEAIYYMWSEGRAAAQRALADCLASAGRR